MGRHLRKCSGSEDGAAMQKTADVAAAVGSKRKAGSEEPQLSEASIQLKTRRFSVEAPENSASSENSENSTCETDHLLASCCSSNGSSELVKGRSKFLDLEVAVEFFAASGGDSSDCRERRETTPLCEAEADSAAELESTARPRETSTRRRSTVAAAEKMPSEAELAQFFSAAETNVQKQFIDKYNYDIVKDQPLEGRYEWVAIQLKP